MLLLYLFETTRLVKLKKHWMALIMNLLNASFLTGDNDLIRVYPPNHTSLETNTKSLIPKQKLSRTSVPNPLCSSRFLMRWHQRWRWCPQESCALWWLPLLCLFSLMLLFADSLLLGEDAAFSHDLQGQKEDCKCLKTSRILSPKKKYW